MATLFADSFDPYNLAADLVPYWNTSSGSLLTSTAFGTGQCYRITGSNTATFVTATNETTVYGSVRANIPSGTATQYIFLTFSDAGTAQCTIRWNGDGSIGLYSGAATGTLLQTYTGIFTAAVWNSFQFKVVINNTTGSIEIRMNGATSNTITKTGVNTRAGTTNAFVNGISLGLVTVQGVIDDLFLNNTSGNAPTSWPGDMRAIQQTPVISTSKNFDVFPATSSFSTASTNGTHAASANTAYYYPFTAPITGTLGSLTFVMNSNLTGNVKVAIYDSLATGGLPGSVLATSSAVNNPTTASNTATFSSPPSLVNGVTYYIAYDQDAAATYKATLNGAVYSTATSYASFPVASPGVGSTTASGRTNFILAITNDNTSGVYELQEDGDTSYVYTSVVEEDKYSMSPITTTYSVVAMQYYAMYKRSDVGARTMQLSVAANGSADTALYTDAAIPNTYTYKFKTIENDPTGASWTPTNVNGAVVGLAVTA